MHYQQQFFGWWSIMDCIVLCYIIDRIQVLNQIFCSEVWKRVLQVFDQFKTCSLCCSMNFFLSSFLTKTMKLVEVFVYIFMAHVTWLNTMMSQSIEVVNRLNGYWTGSEHAKFMLDIRTPFRWNINCDLSHFLVSYIEA